MAKAKRNKIKAMSEDEVLCFVNNWIEDAIDYDSSELSQQRANGLSY